MNRKPVSDDTAERVKKMWEAGMPASHIGAKIGKSRDSVLGLIRRLRQSGIVVERIVKIEPITGTAKIIDFPSQKTKKQEKADRPVATGVRMMSLKNFMCRFVEGESQGHKTVFCGERTVQGCSYCAKHKAICYRPVPKSKPVNYCK